MFKCHWLIKWVSSPGLYWSQPFLCDLFIRLRQSRISSSRSYVTRRFNVSLANFTMVFLELLELLGFFFSLWVELIINLWKMVALQKKSSPSSMLSPSTMLPPISKNSAPGNQKLQNLFSRVNLQTYPIQSTLKKRGVHEQEKNTRYEQSCTIETEQGFK